MGDMFDDVGPFLDDDGLGDDQFDMMLDTTLGSADLLSGSPTFNGGKFDSDTFAKVAEMETDNTATRRKSNEFSAAKVKVEEAKEELTVKPPVEVPEEVPRQPSQEFVNKAVEKSEPEVPAKRKLPELDLLPQKRQNLSEELDSEHQNEIMVPETRMEDEGNNQDLPASRTSALSLDDTPETPFSEAKKPTILVVDEMLTPELLSRYLDEYTTSPLSKDQLLLDVRNGFIDLRDVELRPGGPEEAAELSRVLPIKDIPVRIQSGRIGSIRLKLSWKRKGPLLLQVTDTEIVLEEVDENDLSHFEEEDWVQMEAERRIALADSLAEERKSSDTKGAAPSGWKLRLLQILLERVEINLNNVQAKLILKNGSQVDLVLNNLLVERQSPAQTTAVSKTFNGELHAQFDGVELSSLQLKGDAVLDSGGGTPLIKANSSIPLLKLVLSDARLVNLILFSDRVEIWRRRQRFRICGRPTAPAIQNGSEWFQYAQRCALCVASGSIMTEESLLKRREQHRDYVELYSRKLNGKALSLEESIYLHRLNLRFHVAELAALRLRLHRSMQWKSSMGRVTQKDDERQMIVYNLMNFQENEATSLMPQIHASLQIDSAVVGLAGILSLELAGVQLALLQNRAALSVKDVRVMSRSIARKESSTVCMIKISRDEQTIKVSPLSIRVSLSELMRLAELQNKLMGLDLIGPGIEVAESFSDPAVGNDPTRTVDVNGVELILFEEKKCREYVGNLFAFEFGALSMSDFAGSTTLRSFDITAYSAHRQLICPFDLQIQATEKDNKVEVSIRCKEIQTEVSLAQISLLREAITRELPRSLSTPVETTSSQVSSSSRSPQGDQLTIVNLQIDFLSVHVNTVACLEVADVKTCLSSGADFEVSVESVVINEPTQTKRKRWDSRILQIGSTNGPDATSGAAIFVKSENGLIDVNLASLHVSICVPILIRHLKDVKRAIMPTFDDNVPYGETANSLVVNGLAPEVPLEDSEGQGNTTEEISNGTSTVLHVRVASTSISVGDEKEPLVFLQCPSLRLSLDDTKANEMMRLEVVAVNLKGVDCCLKTSVIECPGEVIVEYDLPAKGHRFYCFITLLEAAHLNFTRSANDAFVLFTILVDTLLEGDDGADGGIPDAMTLQISANEACLFLPELDVTNRTVMNTLKDVVFSMVEHYDLIDEKLGYSKKTDMKITTSLKSCFCFDDRIIPFLEPTKADLQISLTEGHRKHTSKVRLTISRIVALIDCGDILTISTLASNCVLSLPGSKDSAEVTSRQKILFEDEFSMSLENVSLTLTAEGRPDLQLVHVLANQFSLAQKEKKRKGFSDMEASQKIEFNSLRVSDVRSGVQSEKHADLVLTRQLRLNVHSTSRGTKVDVVPLQIHILIPLDLLYQILEQLKRDEQALVVAQTDITAELQREQLGQSERQDTDEFSNYDYLAPTELLTKVEAAEPVQLAVVESNFDRESLSLGFVLPSLLLENDCIRMPEINAYICSAGDLFGAYDAMRPNRDRTIVVRNLVISGLQEDVHVTLDEFEGKISISEILVVAHVAEGIAKRFESFYPETSQEAVKKASDGRATHVEIDITKAQMVLLTSLVVEDPWAVRIQLQTSLLVRGEDEIAATLSISSDFRLASGAWRPILTSTRLSCHGNLSDQLKVKLHDEFVFHLSSRLGQLLVDTTRELAFTPHRSVLTDNYPLGSINPLFYVANRTGVSLNLREVFPAGRETTISSNELMLVREGTMTLSVALDGVSTNLEICPAAVLDSVQKVRGKESREEKNVHVKLVRRGAAHIVMVSSGVRLVNDCGQTLWIRFSSPNAEAILLHPSRSEFLPLLYAEDDMMFQLSMDGKEWSTRALNVDRIGECGEILAVRDRGAINVMISMDGLQRTITLLPTIVIENGLPDELQLRQTEEDAALHVIPFRGSVQICSISSRFRLRPKGQFWSQLVTFETAEKEGSLRIFELEIGFEISRINGVDVVRLFAPFWFYCDLPNVSARLATRYPAGDTRSKEGVLSKQGAPAIPFTAKEGFWIHVGRSRWSKKIKPRDYDTSVSLCLEEKAQVTSSARSSSGVSKGNNSDTLRQLSIVTHRWYRLLVGFTKKRGKARGTIEVVLRPYIRFTNAFDNLNIYVGEDNSSVSPVLVKAGESQNLFYFAHPDRVVLTFRIDETGWEWSSGFPVPDDLLEGGFQETVLRFRNSEKGSSLLPRLSVQRTEQGPINVAIFGEVMLVVPILVYNATKYDMKMHQCEVLGASVILSPGSFISYAWDEPAKRKLLELELKVAQYQRSEFVFAGQFDPYVVGDCTFGNQGEIPELRLNIKKAGDAHVVTVSESMKNDAEAALVAYDPSNMAVSPLSDFSRPLRVGFHAPSAEVLLLDDSFNEIISITSNHIRATYESRRSASQVELWMGDMEIVTCTDPAKAVLGRHEFGPRRGLSVPKNIFHCAMSWMQFGPERGPLTLIRVGAELLPVFVALEAETVLRITSVFFQAWSRASANLSKKDEDENDVEEIPGPQWRSIFISSMEIRPVQCFISLSRGENAQKELVELAASLAAPKLVTTTAQAVLAFLQSAHAQLKLDPVTLRRVADTPEGILKRFGSIYGQNAIHPKDVDVALDFVRPFRAAFDWITGDVLHLNRKAQRENRGLTDTAVQTMRQARETMRTSSTPIGVLAAMTEPRSRGILLSKNSSNPR